MTAVAPSMFIGIGRPPFCAVSCRSIAFGDAREAAADDAGLLGLAHQREQAHRARVDAVPAMAEAGDDLAVRRREALEARRDDVGARLAVAGGGGDGGEELHALLARRRRGRRRAR